jgi:8-oxo-dGTP pyrophosphatase MutT (NUDIX family)
MSATRVLRIAAAVILDDAGRMLVVRKRGTTAFMQPGGKLEPGETGAACLARELDEELAIEVDPGELAFIGRYAAPAANEAGWSVDCDVFRVALRLASLVQGPSAGDGSLSERSESKGQTIQVQAEIEEARWASRADLLALVAEGRLAPLTRDNLDAFLADA